MALIIDVRVNHMNITRAAAQRIIGNEHELCTYRITVFQPNTGKPNEKNGIWKEIGEIKHHYDKGGDELASRVLQMVQERKNEKIKDSHLYYGNYFKNKGDEDNG